MKPISFVALRVCLPLLLSGTTIHAATTSFNTGSLGAAVNGTNSDPVSLMQPGAISAGGDQSVGYVGGANTTIPFNASLNPAADVPSRSSSGPIRRLPTAMMRRCPIVLPPETGRAGHSSNGIK